MNVHQTARHIEILLRLHHQYYHLVAVHVARLAVPHLVVAVADVAVGVHPVVAVELAHSGVQHPLHQQYWLVQRLQYRYPVRGAYGSVCRIRGPIMEK